MGREAEEGTVEARRGHQPTQALQHPTPHTAQLVHDTHITHTPAEHTPPCVHTHHLYTPQSPPHTLHTLICTTHSNLYTHVITLTPKPDTLVDSACDPETLTRSRRAAMIDAY